MKITDKQRVLAWLITGVALTQKMAYEAFGCMRLAARIAELRAEGNAIRTTMRTGTDRNGEPCRYGSYKLMEGTNENYQEIHR